MSALTRSLTIDISVDNDLSDIVDFGVPVQLAWLHMPAIEAATTLDIHVAPSLDHRQPADADFIAIATDVATAAVTEDIILLDDEAEVAYGPFRWVRIAASGAQTADREFTLAGICY